jgi:hypothetical protein
VWTNARERLCGKTADAEVLARFPGTLTPRALWCSRPSRLD